MAKRNIWQKSNLRFGDMIRIPQELLISGSAKRFIRAIYEGETEDGLMLRFYFEPGPMSEKADWSYRYFIEWSSIYCGHVKLKDLLGHDIKAIPKFSRRRICND